MDARYALVQIAATGGPFREFGVYAPSVTAGGLVAFQASLRSGGSGVFAGTGGALETVAAPANGIARVNSHPDVNRGASCSFYGEDAEGPGVFLVRGRDRARVADARGPLSGVFPFGPTMNERDVVAFRADLRAGCTAIFVASEGSVTCVADTSDTSECFTSFQGLPIALADGRVLFRGDRADGRCGIYVGDGRSLTTLAETGATFTALGRFPCANDHGTVAFAATLTDGRSALCTVTDGTLDILADSSGTFESFRGAVIDGQGRVAFFATPRGGSPGIFTGQDPADRLLGMGDALLGSHVTDYAVNPVSINEEGQIAIRVRLADGRQSILRADRGREQR